MINFVKAHGLGNDFAILIDQQLKESDYGQFAIQYGNRQLGIGFDQLIIARRADSHANGDSNYDVGFYNNDGTQAEACGNGSRCVAKYLMQLNKLESITLNTLGGQLFCQNLKGKNEVLIKMPAHSASLIDSLNSLGHLTVPSAVRVDIGNPHLVCFVTDIEQINSLGPGLENHPAFINKTNVNFATVINDELIKLSVWERGSGITLACGSGACATFIAARLHNLCGPKVIISQKGGTLEITEIDGQIWMQGEATIVYHGSLN